MRVYGSIQTCFWENPAAQKLSDQGKLLATYLFTGPHSNMIGCFRLPAGYIIEDLNWDISKVKKAFQDLSEMNFIIRDETTSWLIINNFLIWNPIQNPKQAKGVQKLFDAVPSQSIVVKPLTDCLLNHGKYFEAGFVDRLYTLKKNLSNTIDTLSEKCLADKEQNQDQNQDQEQKEIFMSIKPNNSHQSNLPSVETSCNKQALLKAQAIDVLNFLNVKTRRLYRPVDANLKLIIARLNSGATVMDCRQVIAKKTREWKDDHKMVEYLRPATLFNATKFEQYMGELVMHDEVTNGVTHESN